jgi:tight adherence protein C
VTLLLPVLGFLFISLLIWAAAMAFSSSPSTIEQRLGEVSGARPRDTGEGEVGQTIARTLKRLGDVAPRSDKEMGKLKARLLAAGYRSREALITFFGIRVAAGLVLFAVTAMLAGSLILALGAAGLGYLVPTMILARIAKRRQHRIRMGLPDALDLLVVSVEAGLGLDQAIQRVGEELAVAHVDLSDELRLINLELRAGKARVEALKNLADRTGVDDVASLVAMLIQTDKFGTSVAQSLRVHSETLRTKRRQRAEEAAAKLGAKMVFPLVFCIFPVIFIVTAGPAVIKFLQVFAPMAQQK